VHERAAAAAVEPAARRLATIAMRRAGWPIEPRVDPVLALSLHVHVRALARDAPEHEGLERSPVPRGDRLTARRPQLWLDRSTTPWPLLASLSRPMLAALALHGRTVMSTKMPTIARSWMVVPTTIGSQRARPELEELGLREDHPPSRELHRGPQDDRDPEPPFRRRQASATKRPAPRQEHEPAAEEHAESHRSPDDAPDVGRALTHGERARDVGERQEHQRVPERAMEMDESLDQRSPNDERDDARATSARGSPASRRMAHS
jgi:hypothetical protein